MIDWAGGYAAQFRLVRVDEDTWADAGIQNNVISATIDRDIDSDVPLLEGGAFELDDRDFNAGWYRVEMLAQQGELVERYPIATLWLDIDSEVPLGDTMTVSATGYSVLKPAAAAKIRRGEFVQAGVDCAEFARELLVKCCSCPVRVVGDGFTLQDSYVFEVGCSYLQACWDILNAGGWCLSIDGYGEVSIMPKPTEASYVVYGRNAAIFNTPFTKEQSIADTPNVYIAYEDGREVAAENSDEGDMSSTANRFRNEVIDTSPSRLSGETLEEYAERKLREGYVKASYSYSREFHPELNLFTVLRTQMRESVDSTDMRISSQSLTIGNGIMVDEVSREI